jgi:hypothetical protein
MSSESQRELEEKLFGKKLEESDTLSCEIKNVNKSP